MNAPGGAFSRSESAFSLSETGSPAARCGVGGRFPGPAAPEKGAAGRGAASSRFSDMENEPHLFSSVIGANFGEKHAGDSTSIS